MSEKVFLHRFWEEHPDADVIPAFNALRKKRGDEASSRIMWYIRFLNDPLHEYIGSLPRADREKLLVDYCEIKKGDLTSPLFKAAEEFYKNDFMTEVRQVYDAIHEKVLQAKNAIRAGVIYAPEDIDTQVRALKAFKEFAREFEDARMALNAERKTSKLSKAFGKDEFIGPADSGTLFE